MYNVLTPPLSSFCRSCSSKNWVKYEGALEISAVKYSTVNSVETNHQMRLRHQRGETNQTRFGSERPSPEAKSKVGLPREHEILCLIYPVTATRPREC